MLPFVVTLSGPLLTAGLAYLGMLLLPLPLLFAMLFTNRWLFGVHSDQVRGPLTLGMPPAVLIVDLVAAVLFLPVAPRYWRQPGEGG